MNYITSHTPVLVHEMLFYLAPQPHGVYVDATFGGGGHTRALLNAEPTCSVIACDWDLQALNTHGPQLQAEFPNRVKLIWGNFGHLNVLLKKHGITDVDGIIADFGTSQYQIKERAGFSFARDTPLDMRMSPAHQHKTAYDIVNFAPEKTLEHIFTIFGEELRARAIARRIVERRNQKRIATSGELVDIIQTVIKPKPGVIHPATRVFQALRIYVNDELTNIKGFLHAALKMVKPGGRVVCISFHSLEDRIVKNFFNEHKHYVNILTPKVVTASPHEIQVNRSARSAKLRAVQVIHRFN